MLVRQFPGGTGLASLPCDARCRLRSWPGRGPWKIGAIIENRGLMQAAAAAVLEVDQPKVSALIRGRLAGFSLDRLVVVTSAA
jgi:Helix-turn-helix domain